MSPDGAITTVSSGSFDFGRLAAHMLPAAARTLHHPPYLLAPAFSRAHPRIFHHCLPVPAGSPPATAADPDRSGPLHILLLPVIMPLPLILSLHVLFVIHCIFLLLLIPLLRPLLLHRVAHSSFL